MKQFYSKYLNEDIISDKIKDIDDNIDQLNVNIEKSNTRIEDLQKLIKDIKSGRVKVIEDPKTKKPVIKR